MCCFGSQRLNLDVLLYRMSQNVLMMFYECMSCPPGDRLFHIWKLQELSAVTTLKSNHQVCVKV